MMTLFHVALGGAIGAGGRYLVNTAAMRWIGPGFPWGTIVVNVVGSGLMGLLAGAMAQRGGQHLAPFLLTGVLGGFTTFSAFSLDALSLWERGHMAQAAAYVIGSVCLSIAAIGFGLWLARNLLA